MNHLFKDVAFPNSAVTSVIFVNVAGQTVFAFACSLFVASPYFLVSPAPLRLKRKL